MGPSGVGKTTALRASRTGLDKAIFCAQVFTFTGPTGAASVQELVERNLEKRRKGVLGPPNNRRLVVFVDDLSLVRRETYGAQPALELLRMWLSCRGWFERKTRETKFNTIEDMSFAATMRSPRGGVITSDLTRLLRNFNVIACPDMDEFTISSIFRPVVAHGIGNFAAAARDESFAKNITDHLVNATVAVLMDCRRDLRPRPCAPQYAYDIRDAKRILMSLVHAHSERIVTRRDLMRAWSHEMIREFSDRIDVEERGKEMAVFQRILRLNTAHSFVEHDLPDGEDLTQILDRHFKIPGSEGKDAKLGDGDAQASSSEEEETSEDGESGESGEEGKSHDGEGKTQPESSQPIEDVGAGDDGAGRGIQPGGDLLFGDFLEPGSPDHEYVEIDSTKQLLNVLGEHMQMHDDIADDPLQLVLFRYAAEHICRVSRILRQPQGHALLVGVMGSGRHSATILATFMAGFKLFTVDVTRNYTHRDWREDLAKMLIRAGTDNEQIVFLFSDTQAAGKHRDLLWDVSSIVATGTVDGIFAPEDMGGIEESLRTDAQRSMEQLVQALQSDEPAAAAAPKKAASGRRESTPFSGLPGALGAGGAAEEEAKRTVQPEEVFAFFRRRCQSNVRVALCVSPIDGNLRRVLTEFPGLATNCSIDWFGGWPRQALLSVARRAIMGEGLSDAAAAAAPALDTQQQALNTAVCAAAPDVHRYAVWATAQYNAECGRHVYITPTSFLQLLSVYVDVSGRVADRLLRDRRRYLDGLEKLASAETLISGMEEELDELRPILEQKTLETEELMRTVKKDSQTAAVARESAIKEEAVVQTSAEAAGAIETECDEQLGQALPALNAALKALKTLKKSDLDEVKALKKPPQKVKLTLETVCVMLGLKPRKVGKAWDFWPTAQHELLNNPNKMLQQLQEYDRDHMSDDLVLQIREKYWDDPMFQPKAVEKASVACFGLCKWVRAICQYHDVAKVVAPLRENLDVAKDKMAVAQEALEQTRAQLAEVEAQVAALQAQFDAAVAERQDLEDKAARCNARKQRAMELIGKLGGEQLRWKAAERQLGSAYRCLSGDVLLTAMMSAYLGPLQSKHRRLALKQCRDHLSTGHGMDVGGSRSVDLLVSQSDVSLWKRRGLPNDMFSTENAAIISETVRLGRWPLIIDPQGQAGQWLRRTEEGRSKMVFATSKGGSTKKKKKKKKKKETSKAKKEGGDKKNSTSSTSSTEGGRGRRQTLPFLCRRRGTRGSQLSSNRPCRVGGRSSWSAWGRKSTPSSTLSSRTPVPTSHPPR